MIFNRNVGKRKKPIITYTVGTNTYTYDDSDVDNDAWKIRTDSDRYVIWFKKSGTLRFSSLFHTTTASQVFLVGRGNNGGWGSQNWSEQYGGFNGGDGGNGGQCTSSNINITINTDYDIHIGGEDSNGNSTGFGLTAIQGGGVSGGGHGAFDYGSGTVVHSNGAGKDGAYAFGDSSIDGIKYGASGAGGGGSNGTPGGTTGGGSSNGGHAFGQTGAGGGGGNSSYHSGNPPGGSGTKGIVILKFERIL